MLLLEILFYFSHFILGKSKKERDPAVPAPAPVVHLVVLGRYTTIKCKFFF
jgi:hypothetical protein